MMEAACSLRELIKTCGATLHHILGHNVFTVTAVITSQTFPETLQGNVGAGYRSLHAKRQNSPLSDDWIATVDAKALPVA
jgi:hypothetical protein